MFHVRETIGFKGGCWKINCSSGDLLPSPSMLNIVESKDPFGCRDTIGLAYGQGDFIAEKSRIACPGSYIGTHVGNMGRSC